MHKITNQLSPIYQTPCKLFSLSQISPKIIDIIYDSYQKREIKNSDDDLCTTKEFSTKVLCPIKNVSDHRLKYFMYFMSVERTFLFHLAVEIWFFCSNRTESSKGPGLYSAIEGRK